MNKYTAGGITLEDVLWAVRALGPRPDTYEIWLMDNFPEDAEAIKVPAATALFPRVKMSYSGADYIVIMHPQAFTAFAAQAGSALAGIPVYTEEDRKRIRELRARKSEEGEGAAGGFVCAGGENSPNCGEAK